MRTKGAATYGIVRGSVVMQDGKVVGLPWLRRVHAWYRSLPLDFEFR